MLDNNYMLDNDPINGKLGEIYATINGERHKIINVKNIEISIEKKKEEINCLGRIMVGHKAYASVGTGKATLYYGGRIFRDQLEKFCATGEDAFFEMQITNDDSTSTLGRQTLVLTGVNIDGGLLSKMDQDAGALEEDISFTFTGFKYPEKFTNFGGSYNG